MLGNRERNKNLPTRLNKKSPKTSIISVDVDVFGNVICEGHFDIAGSVEGNIKSDVVTIRFGGNVIGEIIANKVEIFGVVKGIIKARHVVLRNTAMIDGTIMHKNLIVEDGAQIDGRVRRSDSIDDDLLDGGDINQDEQAILLNATPLANKH